MIVIVCVLLKESILVKFVHYFNMV